MAIVTVMTRSLGSLLIMVDRTVSHNLEVVVPCFPRCTSVECASYLASVEVAKIVSPNSREVRDVVADQDAGCGVSYKLEMNVCM